MPKIRSIAVAVDGSEHAHRALEQALELAKNASAALTLVSVVPVQTVYSFDRGTQSLGPREEDRRFTDELLRRYEEIAHKAGVRSVSKVVFEGQVVEELLVFLDEHRPDMIVLGARGLSPMGRLFLGSVSDALVHHAHCSVLVVRPPRS